MPIMTTVFADLTMTINGFIAGPDVSPEAPLGVGGGKIHTWAHELEAWRERLGLKGGVTNPDADIMLGSGRRLSDWIDSNGPRFEPVRVVESPEVTHIRYRIAR